MTNRVAVLRVAKGWSQAQMAQRLLVTRQTVIALEAGRTDPGLALAMRAAWLLEVQVEALFVADLDEQMDFLEEKWESRERKATALREMRVLEHMGEKGWKLTGFGANHLQFRRPENPVLRRVWQYERVQGVLTAARRGELEGAGWLYCGGWMAFFHYFKRQAGLSEL